MICAVLRCVPFFHSVLYCFQFLFMQKFFSLYFVLILCSVLFCLFLSLRFCFVFVFSFSSSSIVTIIESNPLNPKRKLEYIEKVLLVIDLLKILMITSSRHFCYLFPIHSGDILFWTGSLSFAVVVVVASPGIAIT